MAYSAEYKLTCCSGSISKMKAAVLTCYQASFLILCIMSLTMVAFHANLPLQWGPLNERTMKKLRSVLGYEGEGNPNSQTEYTKEPRACVMPQTVVMPEYFRKKWRPKSFRYMCGYESRLARVNDEQQKLVPTSGLHGNTCFFEVTRGKHDRSFTVSKCLPLNSARKLRKSTTSLLITNGTSINLEVNLALTPPILQKLQHWETKHQEEIPISVLMFGADSASRAHVYRSLPKSVEFMKRMNFIDFKGYHSVKASTLTNFMAFLMGLRRDIVRETCCKSWSAPFDPCPLIWKNFSDSNYITMYMEDGDQTFNWGRQSGFIEQPTDYYWHHLFLALKLLRDDQFEAQDLPKGSSKDCASKEGLGEFTLQTIRRFVLKFKHVPFFTFSWLENPFHNDMFALQAMDNSMLDLLEFLKSHPEILRRTLIIFLSDHGDRTSFFSSRSSESFIERASIPLFIRMPEALIEKHPDALRNLKASSNKFVTPFDVHHTLLHVLQKDFKAYTPLPGPPHPPDERTSLFLPVNERRTCAKNNIHPMNCLCNVQYYQNTSQAKAILGSDKNLSHKVLRFAVQKLNEIVKQSKYAHKCEKWKTLGKDRILRVRNIGQTKDSLEFLMVFSALNGQATFDIRLKVDLVAQAGARAAADKAFQLVGIFRSNSYGNQSWCVGRKTDRDKTMKEFCYCRKK